MPRARDQALKAEVIHIYGGGFCRCCGETRLAFLTLDHIGSDGALHRKELGRGVTFYRNIKKLDFPLGLRVLCWNCNAGRQINGGLCPHKDGHDPVEQKAL